MSGDRRVGAGVDHCSLLVPRMPVVPRAEQLTKLGPRFKRGQRGMSGDDALALVSDEREQLLLLLVIDRHVAMPEKEDRIDVGERGTAARGLAGGALRRPGDDVR